MAIDLKYGKVTTERGSIASDEPVVVFRAQDGILPNVLAYYHLFCVQAGSPEHHLRAIMDARNAVIEWQKSHAAKVPSSDALAACEAVVPGEGKL